MLFEHIGDQLHLIQMPKERMKHGNSYTGNKSTLIIENIYEDCFFFIKNNLTFRVRTQIVLSFNITSDRPLLFNLDNQPYANN